MISAATLPPAPWPKPVIPRLVLITTTIELGSWENGPRNRHLSGSSSEVNFGSGHPPGGGGYMCTG
jgi:hypothetical protein